MSFNKNQSTKSHRRNRGHRRELGRPVPGAGGFDVGRDRPRPNAEANLRKYVDEAWGKLEAIASSPERARPPDLHPDMKAAWRKADSSRKTPPSARVQDLKLFRRHWTTHPCRLNHRGIEFLRDHADVMQSKCKHPERVLVGHRSNPPHIIPLVESRRRSQDGAREQSNRQLRSYASIGKKPIQLRKESFPISGVRLQQSRAYREMLLPH